MAVDDAGTEQEKRDRESGMHLPKSKEIFERILGKAELLGPGPAYVQINVMEIHSPHLVREEYLTLFQNYPVRGEHGAIRARNPIRPELTTLAEVLREGMSRPLLNLVG